MSDAMPRDAAARVARIVSIVLHPFAAFACLALVAGWVLDRASVSQTAIGIAVAIGIVWAFVLQRRRAGHWQTVDASRRHERPLLYVLALLVTGAYWWWMGGRASATSTGILAAVAMLCIAGIANRWIKLSLHMASLAFAGCVLLRLMPIAGITLLALLPLLGWSRLRMARHTLPEIIAGSLLGLASGACVLALG
jgi:hypothetical protein